QQKAAGNGSKSHNVTVDLDLEGSSAIPCETGLFAAKGEGGGGGIRTRERFRVVGFQDRCNRPLCHPSDACHPTGLPHSVQSRPQNYRGRFLTRSFLDRIIVDGISQQPWRKARGL